MLKVCYRQWAQVAGALCPTWTRLISSSRCAARRQCPPSPEPEAPRTIFLEPPAPLHSAPWSAMAKQSTHTHKQDAQVATAYKDKRSGVPFCMALTSEDALAQSCRWRRLSLGYRFRFPVYVPMKTPEGTNRSNELKSAQTVRRRYTQSLFSCLGNFIPLKWLTCSKRRSYEVL